MSGERNIDQLLTTIQPRLTDGCFVFKTSKSGFPQAVLADALMIFKEVEGTTIIVPSGFPDDSSPQWAMITLMVHSDLEAVGLLAAVSHALAAVEIPINSVSAFFHDHLFVPFDRRFVALDVLNGLSRAG